MREVGTAAGDSIRGFQNLTIAETITLTPTAILINGVEFPYWIGTDINVTDFDPESDDGFVGVNVTTYAHRFEVQGELGEHTHLTQQVDPDMQRGIDERNGR